MFLGGGVQQVLVDGPWDEALAFAKLVWKDLNAQWWGVPLVGSLVALWLWRRRR